MSSVGISHLTYHAEMEGRNKVNDKLHDGMHPTQQMATHSVTIFRHESAIVRHAGVHQS